MIAGDRHAAPLPAAAAESRGCLWPDDAGAVSARGAGGGRAARRGLRRTGLSTAPSTAIMISLLSLTFGLEGMESRPRYKKKLRSGSGYAKDLVWNNTP